MTDHDWEDRPLRSRTDSEFGPFPAPDGRAVRVSLRLNWQVMHESLRVCRTCGQESVDWKDPPETCGVRVTRDVMEA